jgi:hypothetical protein
VKSDGPVLNQFSFPLCLDSRRAAARELAAMGGGRFPAGLSPSRLDRLVYRDEEEASKAARRGLSNDPKAMPPPWAW